MSTYKIYEDGKEINRIVAEEDFTKQYCLEHNYTYEIEIQPEPITPILNRIAELKTNLSETDYKAIKYSEGLISDEDYAPIKAERQAWRDEINKLEQEL